MSELDILQFSSSCATGSFFQYKDDSNDWIFDLRPIEVQNRVNGERRTWRHQSSHVRSGLTNEWRTGLQLGFCSSNFCLKCEASRWEVPNWDPRPTETRGKKGDSSVVEPLKHLTYVLEGYFLPVRTILDSCRPLKMTGCSQKDAAYEQGSPTSQVVCQILWWSNKGTKIISGDSD